MVQAMVFEKRDGGSVGVFHTCETESEAWEWAMRQNRSKKNVLVVSDEDIDLAWLIFGANKGGRYDA